MMTLQQDFQAVENWVVNFFATLKHDVEVVEQDVIKVAQFLQAHGSQIATGVVGVVTAVAAAGVGIPAPILLAAQSLTTAASIVNQAVAAQQMAAAAGKGVGEQTVTLLATGYQHLKEAQSHLANGQSSASGGKGS